MNLIKLKSYGLSSARLFFLCAWIVSFLCGCQTAAVQKKGGSTDERVELLNNAARTAFNQDNIRQAEAVYEKVLDRAFMRDDFPAIVDAKYNLTICRMRLGRYADALDTIQSAKRDAEATSGERTAELKILEAQILYRMQRLDAAWGISEQLIKGETALSPEISAMAHALRGLIACDQSDIQTARAELGAMGYVSGDFLQAEHAELSGRIAMLEKDWQGAIKAFEEEISHRRRSGHYEVMADALAHAGMAYEKAGDLSRAANRFFRAGRSAQIQNMPRLAFKWLTRAQELASRVGDKATAQEARMRLSQIPTSPSR
ncbi:tetratricopeptide repeat protein [Thermodesulfobacteriota bacterium]